jgi:MFS transporter, FHS family, L-fucose permease
MGLKDAMKNRSALRTSNTDVTTAAQLTLKQSLYPLMLVTSLFFLWVRLTHQLPLMRLDEY